MPSLLLGERLLDVELIVFDKDGVLLDFHYLWAAVTRVRVAALCAHPRATNLQGELLDLLGLDPEDRVVPTGLLAIGSRHDSTLAAATRLHLAGIPWNEARVTAFAAFEAAEAAVDFGRQCRPLPGVVETIRHLAAEGFRLAIATTDQTEGAHRFLELTGLTPYFSAVIGVDQVTRSKPAPDMIELACQQAGIRPEQAVMVGDVDLDLRMGRAAGVQATIGVLSGVGNADLLAPHADYIIPDISQLVSTRVP